MKHDPPPDHWTPELVEDRLIEAVRFAACVAGHTGPAGITSAMPIFVPGWEDFLEEGWGLPEPPEEEKDAPRRPTPAEVTRMIGALHWVADILAPEHPRRARAVNAWIMARAYNLAFSRVIRERGMSRAFAYRLRDQGLSIISQRLAEKGVPPWPER